MINDIIADAKVRMEKSVDALKSQLTKVRTGRAHPSLLDGIQVSYYGADTPLRQVANVSIEDSRTLAITVFDKSLTQAVEKAIMASNLGLNPMSAGTVIRVPLPPLTEERRKEFVKVVKNMAEEGRVTVRNIRRDARKVLETAQKDGDISQDDLDRAEKELEQITHTTVEAVDKAFARKEQELLEV